MTPKTRTTKNGRHHAPGDAHADPQVQRLIEELRTHQIELELQNEELRQAQVELTESRDRLQDLYDLAPFGYVTLGERGEVLTSNAAIAALLGLPGLNGRRLESSVVASDRTRFAGHLAQALESPGVHTCRLRLHRQGPRTFWARLETIAGAAGAGADHPSAPAPPLHRMFICDVDDQRKAEEVLKTERDDLFQILEAIPDGVFLSSVDGELEYVNQALTRVFGPYAGKTHIEYFDRAPSDEGFDLDRLLAHGSHRWQWRSDKTHRIYDVVDTLLRRRDGEISNVEIFRDITELKEAEQALANAAIRKDEFLALLAHELRNPLAPLLHAAQLIDSTDDPALVEEARTVIENQVRHMAHLIDDLLDIARVTSGKITLKKERVDLSLVAESVRGNLASSCEEAGLSLRFCPHDSPVIVEADPVRLAQIVTNLLSNAIKFTPPGGSIEISTGLAGRRAQLRIRDTGWGVADEELPHIFEMFHQVRGPAEQQGERGLGVGLALARNLAALHGGTLEAASSGLDQGTELTLQLPLAAPQADAGPEAPLQRCGTGSVSVRVVVVDDNRDSANALGRLLGVMGHDVRITFDGQGALAICREFRPAAVILDIGMPGMDGHEVARQLRRLSWGADVTLVALTGWGHDRSHKEARSAGFDHYMIKPAESDELERLLVCTGDPGTAPVT